MVRFCWRHRSGNGKPVNRSAELFIMLDQRSGPLPERLELYLDHLRMVIKTRCPVPANITLDATHNIVRGTLQNDQSLNVREKRHVPGLSLVPWDAVQDEYIMPRKAYPVKEQGDDLPGKGKVLILEQESTFENTMDKVYFGC
jgi:hypothetical protein